MSLTKPSSDKKIYGEIAVNHDDKIHILYNKLSAEERVYAYYLYRASLPGNIIVADQTHRHSLEVIYLFNQLYKVINLFGVSKLSIFIPEIDSNLFYKELEIYLAFLITNHGFYFIRENKNNKRTPNKMNLKLLNYEN